MTPLLEAVGLSKSFGSNAVLRNVSLTVQAGAIVSLIGENGAGKSTTLKAVMGMVDKRSGQVQFMGTCSQGVPGAMPWSGAPAASS